jgi:hypothetical protein
VNNGGIMVMEKTPRKKQTENSTKWYEKKKNKNETKKN